MQGVGRLKVLLWSCMWFWFLFVPCSHSSSSQHVHSFIRTINHSFNYILSAPPPELSLTKAGILVCCVHFVFPII